MLLNGEVQTASEPRNMVHQGRRLYRSVEATIRDPDLLGSDAGGRSPRPSRRDTPVPRTRRSGGLGLDELRPVTAFDILPGLSEDVAGLPEPITADPAKSAVPIFRFAGF
jgi:hypothetical protein